jgi:hypothetical protein
LTYAELKKRFDKVIDADKKGLNDIVAKFGKF